MASNRPDGLSDRRTDVVELLLDRPNKRQCQELEQGVR